MDTVFRDAVVRDAVVRDTVARSSVAREVVQLRDRTGRPLTLDVSCRYYQRRYALIVVSRDNLPARQLAKNAEHIAHQLMQQLQIDPAQVDFFQYHAGQCPVWRRWRFRWVGLSPLLISDEPLDESAKAVYLRRLLQDGRSINLSPEALAATA
ncbi:hypothetical protein G8764_18395 [Pseudomaricurvus alcaniphilus]|uniref:hypothetical protein n=1 Tax=Pseudomaricurvus alcaniphilus TaxID=1166482 RepID=UPI00140C5A74|nr:hypothetical protein [Pseudomaricurvus alcaniphilus]NHN39280.1 hypothetical protein [Pseudomaricurvus alcaniphilus]